MRKTAIVVLAGWVFGCGASASTGGDEGQGPLQNEDSVVAPDPAPAASAGDAGTEPSPSKKPDPSAHRHAPLPTVQ